MVNPRPKLTIITDFETLNYLKRQNYLKKKQKYNNTFQKSNQYNTLSQNKIDKKENIINYRKDEIKFVNYNSPIYSRNNNYHQYQNYNNPSLISYYPNNNICIVSPLSNKNFNKSNLKPAQKYSYYSPKGIVSFDSSQYNNSYYFLNMNNFSTQDYKNTMSYSFNENNIESKGRESISTTYVPEFEIVQPQSQENNMSSIVQNLEKNAEHISNQIFKNAMNEKLKHSTSYSDILRNKKNNRKEKTKTWCVDNSKKLSKALARASMNNIPKQGEEHEFDPPTMPPPPPEIIDNCTKKNHNLSITVAHDDENNENESRNKSFIIASGISDKSSITPMRTKSLFYEPYLSVQDQLNDLIKNENILNQEFMKTEMDLKNLNMNISDNDDYGNTYKNLINNMYAMTSENYEINDMNNYIKTIQNPRNSIIKDEDEVEENLNSSRLFDINTSIIRSQPPPISPMNLLFSPNSPLSIKPLVPEKIAFDNKPKSTKERLTLDTNINLNENSEQILLSAINEKSQLNTGDISDLIIFSPNEVNIKNKINEKSPLRNAPNESKDELKVEESIIDNEESHIIVEDSVKEISNDNSNNNNDFYHHSNTSSKSSSYSGTDDDDIDDSLMKKLNLTSDKIITNEVASRLILPREFEYINEKGEIVNENGEVINRSYDIRDFSDTDTFFEDEKNESLKEVENTSNKNNVTTNNNNTNSRSTSVLENVKPEIKITFDNKIDQDIKAETKCNDKNKNQELLIETNFYQTNDKNGRPFSLDLSACLPDHLRSSTTTSSSKRSSYSINISISIEKKDSIKSEKQADNTHEVTLTTSSKSSNSDTNNSLKDKNEIAIKSEKEVIDDIAKDYSCDDEDEEVKVIEASEIIDESNINQSEHMEALEDEVEYEEDYTDEEDEYSYDEDLDIDSALITRRRSSLDIGKYINKFNNANALKRAKSNHEETPKKSDISSKEEDIDYSTAIYKRISSLNARSKSEELMPVVPTNNDSNELDPKLISKRKSSLPISEFMSQSNEYKQQQPVPTSIIKPAHNRPRSYSDFVDRKLIPIRKNSLSPLSKPIDPQQYYYQQYQQSYQQPQQIPPQPQYYDESFSIFTRKDSLNVAVSPITRNRCNSEPSPISQPVSSQFRAGYQMENYNNRSFMENASFNKEESKTTEMTKVTNRKHSHKRNRSLKNIFSIFSNNKKNIFHRKTASDSCLKDRVSSEIKKQQTPSRISMRPIFDCEINKDSTIPSNNNNTQAPFYSYAQQSTPQITPQVSGSNNYSYKNRYSIAVTNPSSKMNRYSMPVSNTKNINTNRYSFNISNPTTNVNRNSIASGNLNTNTSTNDLQPKPIIKKNSPEMNGVTVTTTKPKSALKNINRNSVSVASTTKKVIKINTNRNSVPVLTTIKPIIKKGNTKHINNNGSNSNPSSPSNSIKSNSTNSSRGNVNQQKAKPVIKSKSSSMNVLSSVIPNDFVSPLTPYSYTPYTPYVTPYLNENDHSKDDIAVPQYEDNSVIVPPNVNDNVNTIDAKIINKGTKNINRFQKSDISKEGKNDAILRENNKNRTISKRTSSHENNTSFSKIKRRSIFTRIF